MRDLYKRLSCFFLFWIGCLLILYYCLAKKENTIVIGAKNNPECQILAEILAQFLEKHTCYHVERKICLEGTYVAFHALSSNSIDLYVDYTGTLLLTVLSDTCPKIKNPTIAQRLSKYGIRLVFPFGFSNSYVLLTRKNSPIPSLKDLYNQPVKYGFDAEFIMRKEFSLVKNHYGLCMSYVRMMDPALLYLSLEYQDLDVICANKTDGDILRYSCKILPMEQNLLPKYKAVCLAKKSLFDQHPDIEPLLLLLKNRVTLEQMRAMNFAFVQGQSFRLIAKKFLQDSRL